MFSKAKNVQQSQSTDTTEATEKPRVSYENENEKLTTAENDNAYKTFVPYNMRSKDHAKKKKQKM